MSEDHDYELTVTPNDGSLYVHVECSSCKEKAARIGELEAENERLRRMLKKVYLWDGLDAAADGPFVRNEIAAVLAEGGGAS